MDGLVCWIILEGQNFAASIFDTQDLSTIRGGSLLMRDLILQGEILLQTRWPGDFQRATRGGSLGIWRVTASASDVLAALPEIRAALAIEPYQHLAFGLAALQDDGAAYSTQRLRLRAILQRARLAEVRLPYPDLTQVEDSVCPVDLIRPVAPRTVQKIGPDEVIRTSQAVFDRRQFGIKKKQSLIAEETASNQLTAAARTVLAREGRVFAMQIGSISEQAKPPEGLKKTLQDKVCIITLDGNGFGKIQDQCLALSDTIAAQVEFDEALARMRSDLIARVFSRLVAEGGEGPPCAEEATTRQEKKDPIRDGKPVVRFELLLWGGDEIMFIVPARTGWAILKEIGDTASGLEILGHSVGFSVGAVFCHHDAPVARIKTLADNLCSHIKGLKPDVGGGRDGKADTLFMVEVLESFDHVGLDLDAHLARRLPEPLGAQFSGSAAAAFRVLDLAELNALAEAANALAAGQGGNLSRGRLRQTAFALHSGAAPGTEFAGLKWLDFVKATKAMLDGAASAAAQSTFRLNFAEKAADPVAQNADEVGQARFFTLLEEYWDYLTPVLLPEAQQLSVA